MVDMITTNGIFTWNNIRGGSTQISSHLDHFFIVEQILTSGHELSTKIPHQPDQTTGASLSHGEPLVSHSNVLSGLINSNFQTPILSKKLNFGGTSWIM